jgi:hypothetical protein
MAPGTIGWARILAALAMVLSARGWRSLRPALHARACSPSGSSRTRLGEPWRGPRRMSAMGWRVL